jgi:2-iminobutanoate/2-iminopropanoate deaminase
MTSAVRLVFVALQTPVDPVSGKIISGDLALRTHQALANLLSVLQASGCRLQNVARLTAYVTDLRGIEDVYAVLRGYFRHQVPAMILVQVVALPQGAEVAFEAVASRRVSENGAAREVI